MPRPGTRRVILASTFESDSVGSNPSGWTIDGESDGNVCEVVSSPTWDASSTRALSLYQASASVGCVARRAFTNAFPIVTVRIRCRFPSTDKRKYVSIKDSTTNIWTFRFNIDGNIEYYNGSAYVAIQAYSADTWYKIEVRLDCVRNVCDVLIDDVVKLENVAFRATSPNGVCDSLELYGSISYVGATIFADDIEVSAGYRGFIALATDGDGDYTTHPQAVQLIMTATKAFCFYRSSAGDIKAVSLDLQTLARSGPYTIHALGAADQHVFPCAEIDADGYFHVVYGGHDGTTPVYYVKSTNALDVSAWGSPASVWDAVDRPSYPKIVSDKNATLRMYARVYDGSSCSKYIKQKTKTSGGSWGSASSIMTVATGDDAYLTSVRRNDARDRIIFALDYYDDDGDDLDHNCYVWTFDVDDDRFEKTDGTALTTEFGLADIENLYTGTVIRGAMVCFDDGGIPHAFYIVSAAGIYHRAWNGSSWDAADTLASLSGSAYLGTPHVYSSRIVVAYTTGGEILWLISDDDGVTWRTATAITDIYPPDLQRYPVTALCVGTTLAGCIWHRGGTTDGDLLISVSSLLSGEGQSGSSVGA